MGTPIYAEDFPRHVENRLAIINSGNVGRALSKIHELGRKDTEQAFETATSPDGESWPPRKINKWPDGTLKTHPLLRLWEALQMAATGDGSSGHIASIESRSLAFGVNMSQQRINYSGRLDPTAKEGQTLIYARAQQKGYGNLPARPYLGLTERSKQLGASLIMDELDTQLKAQRP